MTTRIALRRALDILPRFDHRLPNGVRRTTWHSKGQSVMTGNLKAPQDLLNVIDKIVDQSDAWGYHWPVSLVDVSGDNVWVIHSSLTRRSLSFLANLDWKWNDWPRKRLPCYIIYHGKVIVWNGTHRMTLAKLANHKVRARVLDVAKYIAWKEKHPERQPKASTVRAFAAARKERRAERKAKWAKPKKKKGKHK